MFPARGQAHATVTANRQLCEEHWRLTLRVAEFPPTAPGQFIQLGCGPGGGDEASAEVDWPPSRSSAGGDAAGGDAAIELRDRMAMLRRPFSLAGRRDCAGGGVELEIIHRVVGAGTLFLSRCRVGDELDLIGPLGNRFPLPSDGEMALLVGGGVGIPPMLYLAEALAGRPAVAFAGALRRSLLPLELTEAPDSDPTDPRRCVGEFSRQHIPAVITTDDGSAGYRGFVTQALSAYLDAHVERAVVYTCGPEPMMKRVAAIAAERGLTCHVAVERAMACGMGTCQSCCIKVKKADPAAVPMPGREWAWRLACTDGPIFSGDSLLW